MPFQSGSLGFFALSFLEILGGHYIKQQSQPTDKIGKSPVNNVLKMSEMRLL